MRRNKKWPQAGSFLDLQKHLKFCYASNSGKIKSIAAYERLHATLDETSYFAEPA